MVNFGYSTTSHSYFLCLKTKFFSSKVHGSTSNNLNTLSNFCQIDVPRIVHLSVIGMFCSTIQPLRLGYQPVLEKGYQAPPLNGTQTGLRVTGRNQAYRQTTPSSSKPGSHCKGQPELEQEDSEYQFKQRMLCKIELTAHSTNPLTLSMLAEFSLIIDA